MTTPLALAFYEHLLPGSQLVNGLQDLGYRVQTLSDVQTLALQALQEKPLLVVTDLVSANADVCAMIRRLKRNPETRNTAFPAWAHSWIPALPLRIGRNDEPRPPRLFFRLRIAA